MSWEGINLAAAEYDRPADPPQWAGLLYDGKRHLVTGAPESAKTIFAWILAHEVIHLEDEMQILQEVAHIDFEMGPHASRALLVDLGWTLEDIKKVWYIEPDSPPSRGDADSIIEQGIALVVIDASVGAFNASGLDDNSRKDAEEFARVWIQPFYKAGISTILIDHVTKDATQRGRWAIGSERKMGGCDVAYGLETVKALTRGGHGIFKVRVNKDRPGFLTRPYATTLELHSDPMTHAIRAEWKASPKQEEGDRWRPTILMQMVSEYLAQRPDGASRNEIEKGIRGKSNEHKRQAIDELVALEYAAEREGPRGARIVVFVKSFTSPDFAASSPGEVNGDLAYLAPPLQGGEVLGEDEVEYERLADLARTSGA